MQERAILDATHLVVNEPVNIIPKVLTSEFIENTSSNVVLTWTTFIPTLRGYREGMHTFGGSQWDPWQDHTVPREQHY